MRSIACEHGSLSPDGWGRGWETAHWAMLTGAAAWLVWDRLTVQTRSDVVAMLIAEADRQSRLAVPYWALADGTVLTPGDTKAEECAWNAGLLSLAAAMMPSAPHVALWRAKAAELAVAAYAVPSDVTSAAVVNGVPLASRLQGYNAYADGTVENHQRIHPDYAANVQLLWLAADFGRLARQRVPEAMFHSGGLVYSALSTQGFQPGAASPAGGTFLAPGGTSYVPGTNTVYYPQGDDWGLVRRAHFVSLDAHALVYRRYLGATGWPAGQALAQHERGQRALAAASGADDGRTYSVDPAVAAVQDTYPGREEYAAQSLASAWLALYVRQIGVPHLDRGALPVPVATARAPARPLRPPARTVSTGPALVVGAAIVRDGRLLAARRTTPAAAAGRWELPGGKVSPGRRPTPPSSARSARSSAAAWWSTTGSTATNRSAAPTCSGSRCAASSTANRHPAPTTTRCAGSSPAASTTSTGSSPTDPSCPPCGTCS